jgi:aryl-alcohol dehydrogenase-like predicted oxidoreductase
MRKRKLGSTGLDLSVIGFGTWAAGGPDWRAGWGPQDDGDSIAAIRRALELGVNWIDTAAVYGLGHAEDVVAQALDGIPAADRPLVATKCGRVQDASNNLIGWIKRESVLKECDASLKRLKVDCIDLYQLHWPEPDEDIEEAWSAMAELQRSGKVRFIGVSNFSVPQMRRAQKEFPIASLQPPYSMLRRDIEAEILPFCEASGIGVICYSPMQAGLLTGAFSHERLAALPENDWRRNSPRFKEPQVSQTLAKVEQLKKIASEQGITMAQLALAWVLRRPEVTSAIVGSRRPKQIEETVPAGDVTLSEESVAAIEKILTASN